MEILGMVTQDMNIFLNIGQSAPAGARGKPSLPGTSNQDASRAKLRYDKE
jgi:hypothetical protein